jgi:hypothetical protein
MTKAEMSQAERNFIALFGGCPQCGGTDGIVNIGRSHWLHCSEHKVKWWVGSNLFDSWRHETEEEQRKIYDDIGMGECRQISCEEAHTHPLVRQWERDLAAEQRTFLRGNADETPPRNGVDDELPF